MIVGSIDINTGRCKGCALCVEACPKHILRLSGKVNVSGYPYIEIFDEDNCIGCASCGIICPDGCITVYKVKN